MKVKAVSDYYDDIHFQRQGGPDTTLCGLKTAGLPVQGEPTCLRCRQFSTGSFSALSVQVSWVAPSGP